MKIKSYADNTCEIGDKESVNTFLGNIPKAETTNNGATTTSGCDNKERINSAKNPKGELAALQLALNRVNSDGKRNKVVRKKIGEYFAAGCPATAREGRIGADTMLKPNAA